MHKAFKICVSLAAMIGTTSAQAGCWTHEAVEAAKVRNLDAMMMVSALRCRTVDGTVMGVYSSFVAQNKNVLLSASKELQVHFHSDAAYDHYATLLANHYGAGAQGLDCNSISNIAQMARNDGSSIDALANIAEQSGLDPMLDGALCSNVANR